MAAGSPTSMRLQQSSGSGSGIDDGTNGGGGNGGGGACIDDLPDALLGCIFKCTEHDLLDPEDKPNRPAIALVSRRWNRVLHTTPSLWRCYELSASPLVLNPARMWWSVEEQEAWLAAKLRQLRRVAPAVQSLFLGDTAGTDVMPEVLQGLAASQLTYMEAFEYDVPLPAAAMRALARCTRVQEIVFQCAEHPLPSNAGWALGQLTALRRLNLVSQQFPADLASSLARLPHLSSLCLRSIHGLPAVQPLTALGTLRSLILKEERPGGGLTVLPAAAFPGVTNLQFASPLLKVGPRSFPATETEQRCQVWRWQLTRLDLEYMPLIETGTLAALARTLLPTGQPVQCLILRSCTLAPAAWQPASEQVLSAVTCLSFVDCWPAGGGEPTALLNELLGSLPSLNAVTLASCDFSGGLPSALHQLSSLSDLTLSGARLTSLPALPCMTALRQLALDYNHFPGLPALGSAPHLTHLSVQCNQPGLKIDAASVGRLAAEAPNLQTLVVGEAAAAAIRRTQQLPDVCVM